MLYSGTYKSGFDPLLYKEQLIRLLSHLPSIQTDKIDFTSFSKKYPKPDGSLFSKTEVLKSYHYFKLSHSVPLLAPHVVQWLRKKPMRTLSGVTPITVLTKPFPCPGNCIFCPSDVRMPKSYLSSEPGAQRAANNYFEPYLQTYNRLLALLEMGHPVDKAEIIVLGGTWSVYPLPYKIWFIKSIFEALNDFGNKIDNRALVKPSIVPVKNSQLPPNLSYNQAIATLYRDQENKKKYHDQETATWSELKTQQQRNETSAVRCVGLVLESRPDVISPQEVVTLRRLGATKTQIGLQSLQDEVLRLNQRGHDVSASRRAMRMLRQAGFKIHAHWMPNLYGSNLTKDKQDFERLFSDPDFKPDELKIYPCSLIEDTPLVKLYKKSYWLPYTQAELLDILTYCLINTPAYCRLTRIIRDIPSADILVGNKLTNLRELAASTVVNEGIKMSDIRSREIRSTEVVSAGLKQHIVSYKTSVSTEKFIEMITGSNQIAAFLRLSLPISRLNNITPELDNSAIIREVHVYGQALEVGNHQKVGVQHRGLGKQLVRKAIQIARKEKYAKLAVISAIGTRPYYRRLGFKDGVLYQNVDLN